MMEDLLDDADERAVEDARAIYNSTHDTAAMAAVRRDSEGLDAYDSIRKNLRDALGGDRALADRYAASLFATNRFAMRHPVTSMRIRSLCVSDESSESLLRGLVDATDAASKGASVIAQLYDTTDMLSISTVLVASCDCALSVCARHPQCLELCRRVQSRELCCSVLYVVMTATLVEACRTEESEYILGDTMGVYHPRAVMARAYVNDILRTRCDRVRVILSPRRDNVGNSTVVVTSGGYSFAASPHRLVRVHMHGWKRVDTLSHGDTLQLVCGGRRPVDDDVHDDDADAASETDTDEVPEATKEYIQRAVEDILAGTLIPGNATRVCMMLHRYDTNARRYFVRTLWERYGRAWADSTEPRVPVLNIGSTNVAPVIYNTLLSMGMHGKLTIQRDDIRVPGTFMWTPVPECVGVARNVICSLRTSKQNSQCPILIEDTVHEITDSHTQAEMWTELLCSTEGNAEKKITVPRSIDTTTWWGSVNVAAHVNEEHTNLDWKMLRHTVGTAVSMLADMRDKSDDGTARVRVGLTGLSDALCSIGIKYGSEECVALVREILTVVRHCGAARLGDPTYNPIKIVNDTTVATMCGVSGVGCSPPPNTDTGAAMRVLSLLQAWVQASPPGLGVTQITVSDVLAAADMSIKTL